MLITGKITGTLNGQRLDDVDLYSYVLTHSSDSRNFVAISKVPPNIGGSFQVLINVITPINWLFAGKNGVDTEIKLPNGFALTGTINIVLFLYFNASNIHEKEHLITIILIFLVKNKNFYV